MHEAGQIYKKIYSGFYSTREETFLTEKDRRPDGTFDPSYGEVIELKEENYFFKLKEHQQWLIDYLAANPSFVQPDHRRNEVLGFLKNNELEDLCISRPAARLNWGIPLPFDKDFVTYVWFDALVNYISIPAARGDATVLSAFNRQTALSIHTLALARRRSRRRQGHCEISCRLLADHAQGDGTAAAKTNSRAWLVAKRRREDQQKHR